MELLLLLIFASYLLVGVVGNHAVPLPSEVYWKNKLPNTPMPALVHDLLHPSADQEANPLIRAEGPPPGSSNLYNRYKRKHKTAVSEQLNLNKFSAKPVTDRAAAAGPPPGTSNLYNRYKPKHKNTVSEQLNLNKFSAKPSTDSSFFYRYNPPQHQNTISGQLNLNRYSTKPPVLKSTKNIISEQLNVRAAGPPPGTSNLYNRYKPKHKNTISEQLNLNKYTTKPPVSGQLNLNKYTTKPPISEQLNLNKYRPPVSKSTIPNQSDLNSPGASLFFLEKDLHPGAKMNLQFVVTAASGTTFLPQKLAKVTPFSSSKLLEILNQFAVDPKSQEAELIYQTIMDCEQPAIENEEKYCATSLESLVDYGTSKFGKNVNVLTTEIVSDKGQRTQTKKQQYVVSSGVRQIVSDNLVACHSMPYPYAVFFCHATSANTAQAYVVPSVGADGTKIKATAVCHKDTSKWDPGHVAFQVLKVKPGTVPICHFLTQDTIAWAAKNKNN